MINPGPLLSNFSSSLAAKSLIFQLSMKTIEFGPMKKNEIINIKEDYHNLCRKSSVAVHTIRNKISVSFLLFFTKKIIA